MEDGVCLCIHNIFKVQCGLETSLVVELLGICLPMQAMWVLSLVRRLKSHMPAAKKPKHKNRGNIVTKIQQTLKMVHIKKKKKGNVGTQEITSVRTYLLALDEKPRLTFFFFLIYLFLTVLDHCCCAGFSLVEAHRLPLWGLFLLRSTGVQALAVAAYGLSSCALQSLRAQAQ